MPMFGLADVNSFYASCEALFRPDLRGKPVVVLSNNDGCVIARSKAYVEYKNNSRLRPFCLIKGRALQVCQTSVSSMTG